MAKFGVQVLPCVMIFVDGRCVDRLIGFEDLGHNDQFTAKALEFRLKQTGALISGDITLANSLNLGVLGVKHGQEEDEEDDEERRRGKGERDGLRRGKMGIRDGFAAGERDRDEWD